MARLNPPRSHSLPPLMFLHALLILGLAGLAFAILSGNTLLLVAIVAAPLGILTIGYGFHNLQFAYLLLGLYCCSFLTISRYLYMDKMSVGVDILLLYLAAAILIHYYVYPGSINLRRALNPLTISYMVWMLFTAIELLNPGTQGKGMERGIRTIILNTFVMYACTSILSCTPRIMKQCLTVGGIFTIVAFAKLLMQKYVGFDAAERHFLYVANGAATHLIHSGVRYFSIFPDASMLGSNSGLIATVYLIMGFATQESRRKIFYLLVGCMAVMGIFLSGTRSALVIPMVGFALYCLLSKQFTICITTGLAGLFIFVFFAFTTIGQGNEYIRRARTAFQPSEDASMNVRVRNRKEMAEYLALHPMGAGISGTIPKLWFDEATGTYQQGTLPPDSHYVYVWIQNGSLGLGIYIAMHAFWILSGSYIVLFRIRNKRLRLQLASFVCGVFGLMVSGYTNDTLTQAPNDIMIAVALAFVMNGPYIDKQIQSSAVTSVPHRPQETTAI